MSRVRPLLRMTAAMAVWAVIGTALWMFLLSPYWTTTFGCWSPNHDQDTYACLKSVARDLRSDSNLATYATATVAAAIALQLSNRSRESKPPGE